MRSRLLIIIVPVLLLLLGVASVFVVRSRSKIQITSPAKTSEGSLGGQAVPTTTPEILHLKLLAAEQVISVHPSFGWDAVWYMNSAGALSRLDLAAADKQPFAFPDLVKNPAVLLWQDKGSDLLVSDNQDGHIRIRYYNALDKKFVIYPAQIRAPVFLAGNTQIAYDWVSVPAKGKNKTPKHELKISKLDATGFRKIGDLFRPDSILAASPTRQELVMYSLSAADAAPLLFVDLAAGKFQTIAPGGFYTGVKFSPDGSKILVSSLAASNSETYAVYSLPDFKKTDINIPASFGAVAWAADSQRLLYVNASGVFELDLLTLASKQDYLFTPSEKITAREIVLVPGRPALFLTDELSGNLYFLDYGK
jgi:hypothetical protein